MELSGLDLTIIVIFFVCVITLGLWKSRKEKTSEDYFLAGRGLKWWLMRKRRNGRAAIIKS